MELTQDSLSESINNCKRLEELLDRATEGHKLELFTLKSRHEEKSANLESDISELVSILIKHKSVCCHVTLVAILMECELNKKSDTHGFIVYISHPSLR